MKAMDDQHLVEIARQYGGNLPAPEAAGLRPGFGVQPVPDDQAGRRPGLPLRRRSKGALLRLLGTKQNCQTLRSAAFRKQAAHANSTGRNRTKDFVIPDSSSAKRQAPRGKGKWKQWTPDAVLRAAFAKENMVIRHVAEQVDGGSASHAADCKFFASELIMRGQRDGLSKFLEEALKDVGMFDFALTNMIFDETELEINLKSFGLGSWSILASHAQMTFCVNDHTHDFDFIRAPAALPNKQATTMWPALCAGEGGLWPGLSAVAARVRAVLVTCDAAPANIKLLSHLQSVLDQRTLLLPLLCLQHRTGNVIERVTKLLGVLTGSFSVAKTLRSGSVVKRLAGHVRDVLAENLQVFDRVPPGVVEEWAAGQACAKAIFKLVLQGRDDDKASGACQRFLDFFASPWTGPTAGEGSGQ